MALTSLQALTESQRRGLMLKHRLDNALGRVNYPFFTSQILGYGRIANDPRNPGNFEQFNDPRVRENLKFVGDAFTDWKQNRQEQTSFRKVLVIQPRGTCKSATCTIPLPIWAHIQDSEMAGAIISATQEDMAQGKFGKATRNTFEGTDPHSRLVDLYGEFKPSGQGKEWRTDKMTTLKRRNIGRGDPTYLASSVEKGVTAGHFDMVVIDDPITYEKMRGDKEWLNKVWAVYTRLPYVLNRNGLLIVIMTRYDDQDLCGRVIRQEIEPRVKEKFEGALPPDFDYETGWIKYAKLAGWEVRYDSVYDNYDRETRKGDVVYPICWSHEKIAHSRQTPEGERDFWFDLMNRPAQREDQPLTEDHIKRLYLESLDTDLPPQALHAIDLHCDFAFKSGENFIKQTGDWGVIHVVAKYNGHVYRINGYRGKDRQSDFGDQIIRLARWVKHELKSKVRYVTYDIPPGYGSGFESTDEWIYGLFRNSGLPMATPKPLKRSLGSGAKKLDRVLDTIWAWQQGYVHILRGAEGVDPLIYQMLNLHQDKPDDDRDAFADSFHKTCYDAPPVFYNPDDDEWDWKPAIEIAGEGWDDPWETDIGFGA